MGGAVGVEQALGIDGGVDLRGRERGVAEEFLDGAEVGAPAKEVGGEAVAQGVRRGRGRQAEGRAQLRHAQLELLGLVAAMEWKIQNYSRAMGIPVRFVPPAEIPAISEATGITFLRILQEALTNVARHAGASEVVVRLEDANGRHAAESMEHEGVSDVQDAGDETTDENPAQHGSGGWGHLGAPEG